MMARVEQKVFAIMNLARARAIVQDMGRFTNDPRLSKELRDKCQSLCDRAVEVVKQCELELE